jgi:hypothetical protein
MQPSIVTLVLSGDSKVTPDWFLTNAASENIDLVTQSKWLIGPKYPKASDTDVPEHTPPDIARLFKQAHSAKNRGERETAGFVFGKVLEVSLKTLDPAAGGTLASRIDTLAANQKLPAEVKQWAHEIRIVRNDAVHEVTEPSEADIAEITEFVEAFLSFVFTMPKKYELRKSRQNAGKQPPS